MFFKKAYVLLHICGVFLYSSYIHAESVINLTGDCEINYLLNVTTKQKYCVTTALENVTYNTNLESDIESDIDDLHKENESELFDHIDTMESVQKPEVEINQ